MTHLRTLFWVAVAAAAIVAGWVLLAPQSIPNDWRFTAGDPVLVGDSDDPFVYAGGDSIRSVGGSGTLRISANRLGEIRLSIESPEPAPPLTLRGDAITGRSWSLISEIRVPTDVWIGVPVHGDAPAGDPRLPETTAQIAGEGRFELIVDGNRRLTDLPGIWSIANALRQDDGSIRQQGLVFSPLLRDKTGFSDPNRLELTILLYEDGPDSEVLVHLVFRDVPLEEAPAEL